MAVEQYELEAGEEGLPHRVVEDIANRIHRVTCPASFGPFEARDDASPETESRCARSRFTDEQMVKILREADAAPVSEVAKRYQVSEQSLYVW